MALHKKHIALVLGSGGARGLAHIGVIKALEESQIPINIITGTSIGAFVGGVYAAGINVAEMEKIVREVDKMMVAKIFIPKFFAPGLVDNKRVIEFIKELVGDIKIENLNIPFAVVATDLITGEEIIFSKGLLANAIMASISIPTIFNPMYIDNRYLIDGGLCNPLPISVAKKMGAHKIIAVNVSPNPKRITKKIIDRKNKELKVLIKQLPALISNYITENKTQITGSKLETVQKEITDVDTNYSPSLFNVFLQSISISTNSLIAQHLKNAKPDLLISPSIENYDMLEFYKGEEIIECGYNDAKKALKDFL